MSTPPRNILFLPNSLQFKYTPHYCQMKQIMKGIFCVFLNVSSSKTEGFHLFLSLAGVLKEKASEVQDFPKGQHQTMKSFQQV